MRRVNRKTTPSVHMGRVRHKNRHRCGRDYSRTHQITVEREPAGKGFRHLLSPHDVTVFFTLLPDWRNLSIGLRTIVLDSGDWGCDGWHAPGAVALCAWEDELWRPMHADYFRDHSDIFKRLGVRCRPMVEADKTSVFAHREDWELGDCAGVGEFTEETARAFQLLHVLLHELGHHHDRMTSKNQREATRGEGYAELYARKYESIIWREYQKTFGI